LGHGPETKVVPVKSSSKSLLFAAVVALAAASCNGDANKPTTHVPVALPEVAAQTGTQRLSLAQYANVVHDVFGDDIAVPTALEPDTSLDGFVSIGSSKSAVSPRGVSQYEDAAFKIAAQVLGDEAHRAAIMPCTPSATFDVPCARKFLVGVGRRLYRRPLTPDEFVNMTTIATQAAATLGDFYKGLEFGVAALLQAPSFLYRPSFGEPDPARPGKRRYTDYEMATRLAFFLWNSAPDDELLDAAFHGMLTRDTSLASEIERMLDSPKARRGLRSFITEYFRLDELPAVSKDPKIFTAFSPDLGAAAREETLRDVEYLAFDIDGDYRDLFTNRWTFVNPKLASMYEVPAPVADGFGLVILPDGEPRRGLLGQASILALYAHPTSSSATLRGKFVRSTLLCGIIPPPPVNVNTALPEPTPGAATLREREKTHLSDPFCASCHVQMDPIGLGLENFDGIGRFRKKDHGEPIDASGDFDGTHFTGPSDLAAAVHDHPALPSCFVKKMYEYATSFVETPAEHDLLVALTTEFKASGHKIKSLMATIAMSPGFRLSGDQP
jgi:Protein of unknown function (DUF1592)/Protein of unknown function (DUF1588)/Protein of unknown function (DUF1595)/Protein of unknown function (DUF1587)/Protein of unknown function (DUF1585)